MNLSNPIKENEEKVGYLLNQIDSKSRVEVLPYDVPKRFFRGTYLSIRHINQLLSFQATSQWHH
jgi:hypothetical protein